MTRSVRDLTSAAEQEEISHDNGREIYGKGRAPEDCGICFLPTWSNVAACMPGVALESVVDDKTFNLVLKQKVGMFKVTMKGPVVLTSVNAPTHLEWMAISSM